MVSSPSAYRASPSGEKTGSRSCSASGRSATRQSGLSRAASTATVSQSSTVEELGNGLHRPVDVLVGVRERDERRLELRRREVDPSREQVPEEFPVALGVARG